MRRSSNRQNPWQDHYARRAEKEGYPARSVYKLKEVQDRFQILKPGQRVLDLGCAPGSWLLFAAQIVGPEGEVLGVDRMPVQIACPKQVRVIQGDILASDADFLAAIGTKFDVVLSDMAPNTTGIKRADAIRSLALSEAALDVADKVLCVGGSFVCKVFQGGDVATFFQAVKKHFQRHKTIKPQACRKESREIYAVGISRRGGDDVRA